MTTKHESKDVKRLFKKLEILGFTITRRGNTFVITPPLNLGTKRYITHATDKSIKAIYTTFRKMYGIELDPKRLGSMGKSE